MSQLSLHKQRFFKSLIRNSWIDCSNKTNLCHFHGIENKYILIGKFEIIWNLKIKK